MIVFAKRMPVNLGIEPLIAQFVHSGTRAGANDGEANDPGSTREFPRRIRLGKREVHQSKHRLRKIAAAAPEPTPDTRVLGQEARDLHLIVSAIDRGKKGEGLLVHGSSDFVWHSTI